MTLRLRSAVLAVTDTVYPLLLTLPAGAELELSGSATLPDTHRPNAEIVCKYNGRHVKVFIVDLRDRAEPTGHPVS